MEVKKTFSEIQDEEVQDIVKALFPDYIAKEEDIDSDFDYSRIEESGSIKTMGNYK